MKPVQGGGGYFVLPIYSAMSMKRRAFQAAISIKFNGGFKLDDIQPYMHMLVITHSQWVCHFYVFVWDTRQIVASGTFSRNGQKTDMTTFCWAAVDRHSRRVTDSHEPLNGEYDKRLFADMALMSFDYSAYMVSRGRQSYDKDGRSYRLSCETVINRCRNDAEYAKLCPSDVKKAAWQIVKQYEEEQRRKDAERDKQFE